MSDCCTGVAIEFTRTGPLDVKAASHGEVVGRYAAALLDVPLPWTRMRAVYRLLGLVGKWGADRVNDACARALDAEAVDVGLITRMLERATEHHTNSEQPQQLQLPDNVVPARFARDPDEFAVAPTVSPELRQVLRRLKLGHAAFPELVVADEIDRRDRTGTVQRARAAGLDPTMTLDTWEDHDAVTYDHDILAELSTLRFVEDHQCAFILGPVGVGKTTSLTRWDTSPAADGVGSTPNAPTGCSNASKHPGWTTATSTRSAG